MDNLSPEQRRWTMTQVKGRDTTPEIVVRSLLHRLGFRFRVQGRKLAGKPDIVLPKHRTVVFVHGCFWHRHPNCKRASTPVSNADYWTTKFKRTVARDASHQAVLEAEGWRVLVVWECELRDLPALAMRLQHCLSKFLVPTKRSNP